MRPNLDGNPFHSEPEPEPEEWEEPEVHEPGTWHTYDLWTQPDGSIRGESRTNDPEDRCYPGEVESWEVSYPNLETALKRTGGTHQGIVCEVTVYLDGKKIDKHGAAITE